MQPLADHHTKALDQSVWLFQWTVCINLIRIICVLKHIDVFKIQIGDTLDKEINYGQSYILRKILQKGQSEKAGKEWKSKSGDGVAGKYGRYTGGGRLKAKLHQIPARNRK